MNETYNHNSDRFPTTSSQSTVALIEQLRKANTELRNARRAALNVMEDAILSKEALRQAEEKYRTKLEQDVRDRTAELNATKEMLQATLDSSPYAIQAFAAVRDENGKIIDFTWTMTNRQGFNENGDVIGKRILQNNPGVVKAGLFEKFVQVTETGVPVDHEVFYNYEQYNGWFRQALVKMGDGFVMNTEDITEKKKVQEEIKRSRQLLKTTIDSSLEMIQVFKAVRNEKGVIVDFIWVLNNEASVKIYGNVIGESLLKRQPGVVEEGIFDAFKQVVESGVPQQYEKHYVHEQFNGWYYQSVVKLDDGVATTTSNITERKKSEADVLRLRDEIAQKATDKYRTLFNSIDEGFCIIERMPTEPLDFLYLEANPAFATQAGVPDVVGKTIRQVVPGESEEWFRIYDQVLRNGEPLRFERELVTAGRVLELYAFPMAAGGDQLAVLFNDITARKQREQQQQFLMKFSDALRAEADADAIAKRALQMVAEHLQLDRCYVGIFLLDDNRGIFPYQFGNKRVRPMPQEGVRLSDFPEALRKTFDQTLVITDFQNTEGLTETEKQNFAALGFGALLVASARKGANPDWAINAVSATPRRWTDIEIQLIEEVTERTWAAVHRAKAEDALRKSEEKFRTLSDAVPQVIWVNDKNGKAVYFNQRWFRYTGLSFEDSVGGGWQYVVHPDDATAAVESWKAALEHGDAFEINYRLRRHDGSYCWHLGRNVPLKNGNGEIIGWFGSATEIEELKRTERLQHEFIGIASHELKTPLTSIASYAELIAEMLQEQGNASLMQLASKLSMQVGRMSDLINQLLDTTRLEHGRLKYNKTLFDIKFLVADVAEEVLTIAGSRKINVKTVDGAIVLADAERIRQVLVNLLSNAVKYSKERTNIDVSMQVDKTSVTVAVADQGSGIASHELPHVFEKFFRGKAQTAGGAAGIGLGLFISSETIKDHGGSIVLESEEGRGSTVKFTLPTYIG